MPRPRVEDSSSESDSGEDHLTPYKYSELVSSKSIRLLLLQPGSRKSNEIVCELIEVNLDPEEAKQQNVNKAKAIVEKTNDRDEKKRAPKSGKAGTPGTASRKPSTNGWPNEAIPEEDDGRVSGAETSAFDETEHEAAGAGKSGVNGEKSAIPEGGETGEEGQSTSAEPTDETDATNEMAKVVPYLGGPGAPKEYEALSWSWGHENWDSRIQIHEKGVSFYFEVPKSLIGAFKALRSRKKVRVLWVDAISINQHQIDEKNQQVPLMSEIYGKAKNVCVWLGEGDDDSKIAFKFISEEVIQLQDFDKLCESRDAITRWNAMLNLMKRPWFSRRWVVQEIALATDATLYCGREKIPWKDFADAVQLFVEVETATHRLSEVMKMDPKFYHVPRWFDYVSALGASLLVDATGTLFRFTDGTRKPLLSLEYLVSNLSVFQASEPRDTIYALLAIAKDTTPIPVIRGKPQQRVAGQKYLDAWANLKAKRYEVDYQKPYVDICSEFIRFAIHQQTEKTRALDIICRPWAPAPTVSRVFKDITSDGSRESARIEEKMPSWVPQLSGAAYSMYIHPDNELKMGRQNADSLVGLPLLTQRNYSAAGEKQVNLTRIRFKKRGNRHCMSVFGFILDTVESREMHSQSGNIPGEWFVAAGWDPSSREDPPENFPPEEFWRTLVADRAPHGRNPPSYYARACKMSLKKGIASGTLNTTELIDNGRCSVVAEFFRRVQAVIWNRSLMRTTSGNFGIVRKDVRKGDLVCILHGCSVPVILRPTRKEPEELRKETREEEEAEELMKDEVLQKKAREYIQKWKDNIQKFPGRFRSPRPDWKRWKQPPRPVWKEGANIDVTWYRNHPREFYCEFMGECYVHGMMDGEAIAVQNRKMIESQGEGKANEKIPDQVFELR